MNDFDSRNYNIWIHETGKVRKRVLSPPKKNVTDRVVGSAGEILFDQYYDVKRIPINIFMNGNKDLTLYKQITSFLASLGESELVLSYEPYKYHLVTFEDQLEAEDYGQGFIFDTLNFVALCPFGFSRFTTSEINSIGLLYDTSYFYDSGLLYYEEMTPYSYTSMASGQQFSIYHGGNCNFALPKFIFTGSATDITVEQYSDSGYTNLINSFSYGAFSGELIVDSSKRNVYLNGTMDNTTFEGDFVSLVGKETPDFYTRGVIGGISGNTITLGILASVTDDYYNGMIIYSLNENSCIMDRRTIIDYNGTTKVATLDSPFDVVSVGGNYGIYNLKDGLSYFKITGTGFSGLNLLVDFRYVYL